MVPSNSLGPGAVYSVARSFAAGGAFYASYEAAPCTHATLWNSPPSSPPTGRPSSRADSRSRPRASSSTGPPPRSAWTAGPAGLKTFAGSARPESRRHQAQWPQFRGVLEEILSGEMLTRVWTAVLCACDRRRHSDEAEPAARSVLIGHMEARHRVLTLLVRGPGIDAEAVLRLNRLRRRAERWTDLLIGHLAGRYAVSEFAFDPPEAGILPKTSASAASATASDRHGRWCWPPCERRFTSRLAPRAPTPS